MTDPVEVRDRYNLDFSKLHGLIRPADIRVNDRMEARVRTSSDGSFRPMRVWRTSPIGAELLIDSESPQLKKGETLVLELLIAGQRIRFDASVVELIQENEHIALAGVRFHQPESAPPATHERRNKTRWNCWPDRKSVV